MSLDTYMELFVRPLTGTAGIYCLRDPDTKSVMYVGKSGCMWQRYKQHVRAIDHTTKGKWIKSLSASGKYPLIEVIERCPEEEMDRREKHWIEHYFGKGEGTVNTSGVRNSMFGEVVKVQVRIGTDTAVLIQVFSLITGETMSSIVERLLWKELLENHSDSKDSIRGLFSKRDLDFDSILKARTGIVK